ncbi:MAG: hypothetical protein WA071_26710 [Undibacterium umbellatum]|uniref:hypothetical protein n=1 Tax=Undibacterium umbellatum TaxID=2762300 RepID=UPI003BB79B7A
MIILIVPLLIGGISGQLLEASMRAAHIRIEKTSIYLKEPYATLLPKSLSKSSLNTPKDYLMFDEIKILFTGFGKTTVITFPDEKNGVTWKYQTIKSSSHHLLPRKEFAPSLPK